MGWGGDGKKSGLNFNCFVPGFRPDREASKFRHTNEKEYHDKSVDTGTNKDSKYHIVSMQKRGCGG